ncbi:MAG: nucleotide kinase domain-containing protein [Candidatus Omnitrophota bacterium]
MKTLFPLIPSGVFETYWRFAYERQEIFFKRVNREDPPWTEDPILREYKFTNAYRASDRVSQYLIRNVIYTGDQAPEEVFFRILLFKIFNRIRTWELLKAELGEITFSGYGFETYDRILSRLIEEGTPIYSAAYMMPSAGVFGYEKKHRNHLALIERMMADRVPGRLVKAKTMQEAFELIRSYPTLGDFLAYQYLIDINYSEITNFDEMAFIVPGPGARDGIKKCFQSLGGLSEAEAIRFVAEKQGEIFAGLGLKFRDLWGRPLQLIDCQNLFCEVDKYLRMANPEVNGISGRVRIKQKYKANASPIDYFYPPKWGINQRISRH